ncbi:MAG: HNH endonuclease [Chloracidobacterium sp.]|nr:HNH endonuclease [Chloracidobacterium sp.]
MKRARIYIRDRYRCQYCGESKHAKELTLDHIFPRAQGGESTPQNLVTACVKCNQRKGNRTPEQARMPLLTSQKLLRLGLDHVLLCHYAESRPAWRKYLFMDDLDDRNGPSGRRLRSDYYFFTSNCRPVQVLRIDNVDLSFLRFLA